MKSDKRYEGKDIYINFEGQLMKGGVRSAEDPLGSGYRTVDLYQGDGRWIITSLPVEVLKDAGYKI